MTATGYTSGDPDKVDVAGDTMTGPLVLSADPTTALGAATKQYVDAQASGGGTYTHTQSVSASTWNVTHNLGFRPSVAVLGPTGEQVDAAIAWPTLNTVTISLAASMTGTAHLS